jgi:4-oxalocrotonate tautomerase
MPLIQVSLFEGRTIEQKREFVRVVTDDAVRILKCKAEAVDVIFMDIKRSDWAEGGKLISDQSPGG